MSKVKDIYFYYFFAENSSRLFEYEFIDNKSFVNVLIPEYSIYYNNKRLYYYIIISDRELKGFLKCGVTYRPSYFHFYEKYSLSVGSRGFNNYLYGVCLEQYGNALTNIINLDNILESVSRSLKNNFINNEKIF